MNSKKGLFFLLLGLAAVGLTIMKAINLHATSMGLAPILEVAGLSLVFFLLMAWLLAAWYERQKIIVFTNAVHGGSTKNAQSMTTHRYDVTAWAFVAAIILGAAFILWILWIILLWFIAIVETILISFWIMFLLVYLPILFATAVMIVIPWWSRTLAKLGIGKKVRQIVFRRFPGSNVLFPTAIDTGKTTTISRKVLGPLDAVKLFWENDDTHANDNRWRFILAAAIVTTIFWATIPRSSGTDYATYSFEHKTVGDENVGKVEDGWYHLLHGCHADHGCDTGAPNYTPPKHESITPVASPWGFFPLAALVLWGTVIIYFIPAYREEIWHGISEAWAHLGHLHEAHNEKAKKNWEAQKTAYADAKKQQGQGGKKKGGGQQFNLPPEPPKEAPSFGKMTIAKIFIVEILGELVSKSIAHYFQNRGRFASA